MSVIRSGAVSEHREEVLSALMDGAQRILLSGDGDRLTASAVASEAGIARNSIYRYVSSIDDLVEMVLARGFRDWGAKVAAEVAAEPDPAAAVVAYVRSNLTLAAGGEHALQQTLAGRGLSESARERIVALHRQIAAVLHDAVAALDPADPDLLAAAIQAIVDAAFGHVVPGQPADRVVDFATRAAAAVVAAG